MGKAKMTISVPEAVAAYLRTKPNASAVIAEAVETYRAQELEAQLEEAYREDAEEAERLNLEWEPINAEVEE